MAAKLVEMVLRVGQDSNQPESFQPRVADKKGRRKKEDVRQTLLNHMFAPGLELLQDFCRHGPTPEVAPVAMTLVVLLQQNGRVEELIRKLITWKLAAAAQIGKNEVVNLLRDNSLTVMLVMAFAQVEGADFIRGTLYEPLQEIMKDSTPLELNPQSESDPEVLAANVKRLEKYCALILDACEASKPLIPPSFKRICSFIRQEIEKALPEEGSGTDLRTSTKVLSSFFFLRYIIPAVANPEKYALADEVTPGTEPPYRQSLKFIAKVLTNLTNGIEYGQKELHMMPLNSFLQQRKAFPSSMLDYISQVSSDEMLAVSRPRMFSPDVYEAATNFLAAYVQQAIPRVEKVVDTLPEAHARSLSESLDKLRTLFDMAKSTGTIRGKFKALTLRGTGALDTKYTGFSSTLGRASASSAGFGFGVKKSTSVGFISDLAAGTESLDVAEPARRSESEGALDSLAGEQPLGPTPAMSPEKKAELLARARGAQSGGDAAPLASPALARVQGGPRRGSILPGQSVFSMAKSSPQLNLGDVKEDDDGEDASGLAAVAADRTAEQQRLEMEQRKFARQSLVAFRGNVGLYVRKAGAYAGYQVNDDAYMILIPYLSYIWEVLCREALTCIAAKKAFTDTILIGDMEKAILLSVPPTIATQSKLPRSSAGFDSQCFSDIDMQRDFGRFLSSSPELIIDAKLNASVSLDLSAAGRMASVLEYIITTVLSNAVKSLRGSARTFVKGSDVIAALGSDRGLVQLASMLVNYEVVGRKVYNPLPDIVREVAANPIVSPAANAGHSRFAFFRRGSEPKKAAPSKGLIYDNPRFAGSAASEPSSPAPAPIALPPVALQEGLADVRAPQPVELPSSSSSVQAESRSSDPSAQSKQKPFNYIY